MGLQRRIYSLSVVINGFEIRQVQIDPHYLEKHSDSIDDQIILELVKKLDCEMTIPKKTTEGFDYFVSEPVWLGSNPYRLVWLLPKDRSFLGVINAFRVTK